MTVTTYVLQPSLEVTVNGTPLTDVLRVRCQHGFDMRVAAAQITVRALPAGLMPFDEIVITTGAPELTGGTPTGGNVVTRFSGYFVDINRQLWPGEIVLHCRGKLALADTLPTPNNVDITSYSNTLLDPEDPDYEESYGHTDQTMVATCLYNCRCLAGWGEGEYIGTDILGTGKTLGLISKNRGFEWRAGETGLSFIERLDEVTGYRTYDLPDGSIVRRQISTIPGPTAAATFIQGVDIFRASLNKTILEVRNKVVVEGFPGWDGKAPITYETPDSAGGNPFLLGQDGSQWFITEHVSSAMIEHEAAAGATGLSCEEVGNRVLDELNTWAEKEQFMTPRDDVILPGYVVAIGAVALTDTAVARLYWVQHVDVEAGPGFSQIITGIARTPVGLSSEGGSKLISEAGDPLVSE